MACFFFGTLRDRDVLALVIGRDVPVADVETAEIDGFRLARVVDESYPALVPQAGGRVEGVLVSGLGVVEVERLVWFEGKEYAPKTVEVLLTASGARVEASMQAPTRHLEIGEDDWDFQSWQRREKDLLIALTRGHMALFGRTDLDAAIDAWDQAREELQAKSTRTSSYTKGPWY